jgi:hypothetical protein
MLQVATEQQQPHADQHAGNAQDAAPEPSNKRRRRSGVAASGDVSMTSPDVSASTKNQAAKAAKATKAAKTKQSKPSSADGTAAIGAAADEDGMQHVTSQAKQKSKAAAEKPVSATGGTYRADSSKLGDRAYRALGNKFTLPCQHSVQHNSHSAQRQRLVPHKAITTRCCH